MLANRKPSDICNVEGYDAECLLAEMNRVRNLLTQYLPPIARQQYIDNIEVWQMVLEDSGYLVFNSASGYEFKRSRTGPL